MNLLSQRIKEAKRELTNLKTAHRRGLGNLKVYFRSYTAPPPTNPSGWFMALTITVNFSDMAYPFIGVFPHSNDPTGLWGGAIMLPDAQFEFINNGLSVRFKGIVLADSTTYCKFFVYSTSPIDSITHSWSSL